MIRLLLAGAALVAGPLSAQTTAIVGGTVAVGDGGAPIEGGTVLFRDGRIVAAGRDVAVPAGARVVDARGKWVAAGMIAGFSDLGLYDVYYVPEADDSGRAAHSPFGAAIDISGSVNTVSAPVALERAGGVTRAVVAPGSTPGAPARPGAIFAGQGAVIGLNPAGNPVIKARAFQVVELGEDGAALAGGTRASAHAALEAAFARARQAPAGAPSSGDPAADWFGEQDLAAIRDVLDGKVVLAAHVERASDIRYALGLKQRHPAIRLLLVGATEGWTVAKEIAAAGVPVITGALIDVPEAFEMLAATESNVGLMRKAGVDVAISTLHMTEPIQERRLAQQAGNLVAITKVPGMTGLSWGEAFATITSAPAKALGLDADIGSLRPGRRADVVIWDGDPLEVASHPEAVFIDGVVQPIETREGALAKRYRDVPADLPPVYRR